MVSRRLLQKEATREHVYTEAMRLFQVHGYENVNIDDIVRAAKVARGTFYFHFPAKDDVLLELIRRNDQIIVARMRGAKRARSLEKVLEATCAGFADAWRDRRALLPHAGAVALSRIAQVAAERDREPLRIELAQHVEVALSAGELRATMPAQMIADLFLLDVFAALMAWAVLGRPSIDNVLAGITDLFLHGAAR
jgi:AcrR family transcriptional regulator